MPVLMNHHPNGSLTNHAGNFGVWAGTGGAASGKRVDEPSAVGSGFYRSTWTVASTANGGVYTYTNKTLKPNTQYRLTFFVRTSLVRTINPALECYPETGPRISTLTVPSFTTVTNTWYRVDHTFTTPANCVSVTLNLYPPAGWPIGATEDVDGVQVTEGTFTYEYIEHIQKWNPRNERSFYRQRSGLATAPASEQRYSFLRGAVADQKLTTVNDLEFAYYSSLSGLTPANKYSLMDHKIAAWA